MASITFDTRIQNRRDAYAAWVSADPVLLDGEIVVVTIPAETGAVQQEPAVMLKVGDGTSNWSALNWVGATAADVYDWAKAENPPVYSAEDITGIDSYIADYVNDQMGISVDTDTQYQLVKVDDYNYKLQSKGKTDTAWADVTGGAIVIPKYDDTEVKEDIAALKEQVGEGTVASQIDAKIGAIPAQTDYSVTVEESSPEGYAKAYTFKQLGETVATINIPKDMVVESGSVVTNPEGQAEGTYIKLVLANATEDELFINVGDLIEYVTGGTAADGMITVNVDENHVATATINDGTVTLAKLHVDVQTAIGKAHEHGNKALLDTYTQTEADLADAVAKKHDHTFNETELNKIAEGDVAKWNTASAAVDTLNGEIAKKANDADLATVAKTGNINDLIQTEGDYIILNGGKAASWN